MGEWGQGVPSMPCSSGTLSLRAHQKSKLVERSGKQTNKQTNKTHHHQNFSAALGVRTEWGDVFSLESMPQGRRIQTQSVSSALLQEYQTAWSNLNMPTKQGGGGRGRGILRAQQKQDETVRYRKLWAHGREKPLPRRLDNGEN